MYSGTMLNRPIPRSFIIVFCDDLLNKCTFQMHKMHDGNVEHSPLPPLHDFGDMVSNRDLNSVF